MNWLPLVTDDWEPGKSGTGSAVARQGSGRESPPQKGKNERSGNSRMLDESVTFGVTRKS